MKQIVIGICDDEMAAVLQVEKIVIDYLQRVKKEAQILLFQSGGELLEHIEELHILFLDIEMPKMDCIELYIKYNKKILSILKHMEALLKQKLGTES